MNENLNMEGPLELAQRGALFVVNHSGGKDSQAMYLAMRHAVPDAHIIVVHAHLGRVEWQGTVEHIQNTVNHPVYVIQPSRQLLDMVRLRRMWPSARYRQCTSDLKRGPLNTFIRQYAKLNGFDTIVNCMGIRAEESSSRAKRDIWQLKGKNYTTTTRTWYEWLPIHSWSTTSVFDYIRNSGQVPHWAYGEGMSRLSCSFCIMASDSDLRTAARLRPDLAAEYCALEAEIGHSFRAPTKHKSGL
jgi:DNA sulfur modification protein DndC